MHNIKLLHLDVFLGNQLVGGDSLLFAPSLWIFHSPMLIVPRGWRDQQILHSRGCFQLFYVRSLLLRGLRAWSHLF